MNILYDQIRCPTELIEFGLLLQDASEKFFSKALDIVLKDQMLVRLLGEPLIYNVVNR